MTQTRECFDGFTPSALMEMHADALYTYNADGRMLAVNETWGELPPAPRLFLGRAEDGGIVCRLRHDVSSAAAEEIARLNLLGGVWTYPPEQYLRLLESGGYDEFLCFYVPSAERGARAFEVCKADLAKLKLGGFGWLEEELPPAEPCAVVTEQGEIASVCRSVRKSTKARNTHEAGIETLERFRGKGYAREVLAVWAYAVRREGAVPLYSALKSNSSSLRVAAKAGLRRYGETFVAY